MSESLIRNAIGSLYSTFPRGTRNLAVVLAISGVSAGLSFVARVVLQRVLPTTEVAEFALLTSLFQIIGPVASWGQAAVVLRAYSRAPKGAYDYSRDFTRTFWPGLWIIVGLTFLASLLYRLPIPQVGFVLGSSLMLGMTLWLIMVLRSQREYALATLLDRAPHGLMFLVSLIVWLWLPSSAAALAGQAALLAIALVVALTAVFSRIPRGQTTLNHRQRKEGAAFLLQQLAFLATYHGDIAIVGALLSSAQLATYSVVLNLMRPFDLMRSSLQTILITESAQQRRLAIGRIAGYVALPLIALALIYVGFGKFVLHLLFSGRYDDGQDLVTALIPAAFFQAMYTVPFSVITGRGGRRQLRRFIGIDSGIGLVGLGLLWESTRRWMALGTAASTAVIWLARTVFGLRMSSKSVEQTMAASDSGGG